MLKLFGHPSSTCTRKVLMTLGETNTPFELNEVELGKGAHKQEPHVARQPFGRIPAIADDGFEMYESRAICRYVNRKAGGNLVPTDLQGYARVEQWISIETSEFSAHAMKFIYEHVFKRQQAPGVLDGAGKALETTSAIMEKQLAQSPFITGASFSLADIGFMPYIEYAMGTPAREIFAKHPHFVAWWSKISERPTWKKVAGKT
jgi:glutathione S-transferase